MSVSQERVEVLVVDDEACIRELLVEFLAGLGYQAVSFGSAVEALQALAERPYHLVISDINMPQMSGIELLQRILVQHQDTAVVLLTGVIDVDTAVSAMHLGASDYLTKPIRLGTLRITVERALERRRLLMENRQYHQALEAKVAQQTQEIRNALLRLEHSYETTLDVLVSALDAREQETERHSQRVREYAILLARKVGLSFQPLRETAMGALLHDIGKIGIPDLVLMKPGELDEMEWAVMKTHPVIGFDLIRNVDFLGTAPDIVLCHHEHFDGGGYPRGLRGEDIPIGSRIFSIVDTYDALTMTRPYSTPVSPSEARREVERCAGTQFDPSLVEIFLRTPEAAWSEARARVVAARGGRSAALAELVTDTARLGL